MLGALCKLCKPKRPVERRRVVVIHHNDFDGIMGAVSLYRLHTADEFHARGTSRRKMLENLAKAIKKYRPDILYVVDIGPNESELDELKRLLGNKNFKVIWMDHHKWSDTVKKEIEKLVDVLIYDRSTCGAGLAARYAKENGAKLCDCCEELVNLSCDIDLWIRSDPRSEKMSMALGNKRWRPYLQEKLWRCVGWDKDWEDAYVEVIQEMRRRLEKYLKKAIIEFVDGYSIIIIPIKISDVALVSFMAEEVRKENTYDVIVFLSDVGSVHMRRGTDKVDLSELARKLSGGGHPAAAGGRVNYTPIDRLIHKLFLKPRKVQVIINAFREYIREANASESMRQTELK